MMLGLGENIGNYKDVIFLWGRNKILQVPSCVRQNVGQLNEDGDLNVAKVMLIYMMLPCLEDGAE